ncbi:MAG: hypothetical protein R3350_06190 [Saprospiraceae bacterium]|nr:hypothetical protein [Saprospiraceae bacterium]
MCRNFLIFERFFRLADRAIWHLSKMEDPPLRLPLGKTALLTIGMKIDSVRQDLEDYRELAQSTVN